MSAELLEELLSDTVERSEDIRLLPQGCHPVLEFGMKPGSEVVIVGSVKLERYNFSQLENKPWLTC